IPDIHLKRSGRVEVSHHFLKPSGGFFTWRCGMNIISLIISLVSGAVGGNVAGAAMKDKSLGVPGNSLAGILGGGIGGAILQLLGIGGGQAASLDLTAILENIASGGVGGGILLAIISVLKTAMAKKA